MVVVHLFGQVLWSSRCSFRFDCDIPGASPAVAWYLVPFFVAEAGSKCNCSTNTTDSRALEDKYANLVRLIQFGMIGNCRPSKTYGGVNKWLLFGHIIVQSVHHMIEEESVLKRNQIHVYIFGYIKKKKRCYLHHCLQDSCVCLIYEPNSRGPSFGVLQI